MFLFLLLLHCTMSLIFTVSVLLKCVPITNAKTNTSVFLKVKIREFLNISKTPKYKIKNCRLKVICIILNSI